MPGNYSEYEYTSLPSSNHNITSSLCPENMIENLSLGGQSTCPCPARTNCNCSSTSKRKAQSPSASTSPFSTCFWKRTLRNPIGKRPFKPRGSILTPSKLKLLLSSQPQIGLEEGSSSSTSMIATASSSSLRLLQQQQSQDSSEVFIPDLSSLSLGNNTTSDLDLRLQKSLQLTAPTTAHCYPRRFRNLKWKTRILCSLTTTSCSSLPTIREDGEDGEEEGVNVAESSQTGIKNVQNHQSQSQGRRSTRDCGGPAVDDVTIDELASYLGKFTRYEYQYYHGKNN